MINPNKEDQPIVGKYEIGRQMNLFPCPITPNHCSSCDMVTVHFFGKTVNHAPNRLICNECGTYAI